MLKNFFYKLGISLGSLLALSTFNIEESKALVTHPLNYNTAVGTGSLSGSITFDETSVTYGNFVNDNGSLPSWIDSLTITYTPAVGAVQTFSETDYAAIRFIKNTDSVDFSEGQNLVPSFSDINFIAAAGGVPTAGDTAFEMNFDTNEYLLASTPSPLPFLALVPFIYFTRKFKLQK